MTSLSSVGLNALTVSLTPFRAPTADSRPPNSPPRHARNTEILTVRVSVINFLLQMPILFLLLHPGTNVFPYTLGRYPDLMGIYRIQAVAIQSLVQHQWLL